ncbi:hypothetical protein LG634_01565 [Streptomyces bambusae]|uniref:trypsin-like peptidase domain-containing protein n=1 Tax=Streptomyces bambusae TaxID=1550616 RepID=UPI001CFF1869|nr:trypsin-like peptidase domain-containing protein [Streptomyces bambusae]MCB5163537.1 hypothetical protein [Streptomyces bambusae]
MELERRAQVRIHRQDGSGTAFGSGYLVTPRLVLTAAHVVAGQGRITVCLPDHGPQRHPAEVRWRRHDHACDAALLELDGALPWLPVTDAGPPPAQPPAAVRPAPGDPVGTPVAGLAWGPAAPPADAPPADAPPGPAAAVPLPRAGSAPRPVLPQRWGALAGVAAHPVTALGFPRMQGDGTQRYDEQVEACISPGTGALAGRYELVGRGAAAGGQDLPAGVTRWSGMSGAPVFSGELLCGLVRRDRQTDGGVRLTVTPAAVLVADAGFRAVVAGHTGAEPLAEPAEAAHLLSPAGPERDLRSPAMLLRAEAEAVPFRGREEELRLLAGWCAAPEPFSVRVLTGPGGQGKSRLARQLAEGLRGAGWLTGHLRSNLTDGTGGSPDLGALATRHWLLLVVDYAETRPHLVRRVVEQLRTTRSRVRLLLLARSDGEWRTDVLGASDPCRTLLRTAEVQPLLAPGPSDDRPDAFRQAATGLAGLLEQLPAVAGRAAGGWPALAAALPPPDDLADERYASPLTLQMTALAGLLQHGPAPVRTASGEPVEAAVVDHEAHYWEETAATPAFRLGGLRTTSLRRAVAVAAVCGAVDRAEAEAVVRAVPGLPADRVADVAEWLRALYVPEEGRHWGSLQPDRVAEFHVTRTLCGTGVLPDLLRTATVEQQVRLYTVLTRAAAAHHLAGRVGEGAGVVAELSAALKEGLVASQTLARVLWTIPAQPGSPALAGLGLEVAARVVEICRRQAAAHPGLPDTGTDLGMALASLGSRLHATGRYDEACHSGAEGLELFRRTALAPPVRARLLASALFAQAHHMKQAGRPADALPLLEEAVSFQRLLSAEGADDDQRSLAEFLGFLALVLREVDGRAEDELAALEQRARILRTLAASGGRADLEAAATALSYRGMRMERLGAGRADALAVLEEAAALYGVMGSSMDTRQRTEQAHVLAVMARLHLTMAVSPEKTALAHLDAVEAIRALPPAEQQAMASIRESLMPVIETLARLGGDGPGPALGAAAAPER